MGEDTQRRIGDYQIIRELGQGGMGKVYLARNSLSDRIEALKVVLPSLAGQSDLVDRFTREIKVLASLEHPNIAALRTAFTADNQFVMVMEYVEGETLAQRLEQGPFSVADALNYIDQVLAALSYAHGKHIIHRDIKPANMMLTPQGVVKLMDFGLARSGDEVGLTVTGATLGSMNYMSPEQVKALPIDARSDLYSVGVSLYEMITGQHMFSATSSYSLMEAQVKETPRPPIELRPEVPKALSDLVMMAVAKDPAQRFQSADAFRNALAQIRESLTQPRSQPASQATPAAGAAVAAQPATRGAAAAPAQVQYTPSMPPASVAPVQSKPNRTLLLVGVLVLLALLTGAVVYKARQHGAMNQAANPAPAPGPPTPESTQPQVPPAATPEAPAAQPAPPAPAPGRSRTAAPPEPKMSADEIRAEQEAAAARKKLLHELEVETDQLTNRAAAVEGSLETLEQQMRQSGLGLRGDMVGARNNMRNDMAKAKEALDSGDTDRAREYLDRAHREVEKLEKFLGR